MRAGFLISGGIHFAIVATMIVSGWNSTFTRHSGIITPTSRQVALVSRAESSGGRQRPQAPSSSKRITKSEKVVPKEARSKTDKLEKETSGSSGKSSGMVSTGMKIDGTFPHGYYLELVEKKIESMFRPPTRLPGLRTELHFNLQKNGRIADMKVVKSSGNALFDQAAQRAVLSANPLPPLPADFSGSLLGVLYIFQSE